MRTDKCSLFVPRCQERCLRRNCSNRNYVHGELTTSRALLDVKRLGPSRFARGVERDLLDTRLGLPQQFLAAALKRFTALIYRDRFLEWHLAFFEPLDDRFEFFDRALERQLSDFAIRFLRHHRLSSPKL